jgi:tRNA/tmRNA/rRNA uracil-C5-methylase (TrmA/RlmC/RlmD family)
MTPRSPRPRRHRPSAKPHDLVGTELELLIERVAHGGHCVARDGGRVVFVRHALPGERVRAVVTEGGSSSKFLRADAVEVHSPAPGRVTPPCPFARPGRCGGCDWQHADLATQRALKAEVVAEQLRRLAGIERVVVVEPVPGDVDGLGWRTRVRFAVDGSGRLGLHRHRSAVIVPVDRCRIAHPGVDELELTAHPWSGASSVSGVASSAGDRAIVVEPSTAKAVRRLPRVAPGAAVVAVDEDGAVVQVRGRTRVREQVAGREWRVTASGFWQVHPGAAQALVDAVRDALRPQRGETVLDLYAGVGLFAAALADAVGPTGSVVAVEADPRAVADARRNLHGEPTIRVVGGRVERELARLGLASADLVVLDPPRAGAGASVMAAVTALRPRGVAYVACDPAALARDIATLAQHGYGLAALRAFDAFPMTGHVECVALLRPEPFGCTP